MPEIWRTKKEKCMTENKKQKLPDFASLDEMADFFDENDMGDYLKDAPEVHFKVNLRKRTHFVAIDEEINGELRKIAKGKKITSENLVNSWLKEKIADYAEKV